MSSQPTTEHYRACNLCEAICGIEIELAGDEIVAIRGDREDPFSRGHICPKAVALKDIQDDPDRLRRPLRRDGSRWTEIALLRILDEILDDWLSLEAPVLGVGRGRGRGRRDLAGLTGRLRA